MRCTQLSFLYLNANALDGVIPTEIGQLRQLEDLVLSHNRLSGKLPQTLGLCAKLAPVDTSFNAFHGELPGDIFVNASITLTTINRSHNFLSGALPGPFGKQSVISELLLSANNFWGSIPSSLGESLSLATLYLSVNSLHGTIPKVLGNLQNLALMNVSYNQLEGPLPDTGIYVSNNFSAEWFLGNPGLCRSRLPKNCSVLVSAPICRGPSCHSGRLAAVIFCSDCWLRASGYWLYSPRVRQGYQSFHLWRCLQLRDCVTGASNGKASYFRRG